MGLDYLKNKGRDKEKKSKAKRLILYNTKHNEGVPSQHRHRDVKETEQIVHMQVKNVAVKFRLEDQRLCN